MSNFWTCPDSSKPGRTASTRPCRPSLSNGYHCPGTTSASPRIERETPRANREVPPREQRQTNTTASTERACRPSLSNGYKCPGAPAPSAKPSGAGQYTTEPERECVARRIRSFGRILILTFTISPERRNYGTTHRRRLHVRTGTRSNEGMRAAKNETHP